MTTVFSLKAFHGDKEQLARSLSPSVCFAHIPLVLFLMGLQNAVAAMEMRCTFVPPVVLNTLLLGEKQHLNSELLTAEMKC